MTRQICHSGEKYLRWISPKYILLITITSTIIGMPISNHSTSNSIHYLTGCQHETLHQWSVWESFSLGVKTKDYRGGPFPQICSGCTETSVPLAICSCIWECCSIWLQRSCTGGTNELQADQGAALTELILMLHSACLGPDETERFALVGSSLESRGWPLLSLLILETEPLVTRTSGARIKCHYSPKQGNCNKTNYRTTMNWRCWNLAWNAKC